MCLWFMLTNKLTYLFELCPFLLYSVLDVERSYTEWEAPRIIEMFANDSFNLGRCGWEDRPRGSYGVEVGNQFNGPR
jgi:hypothetical protein